MTFRLLTAGGGTPPEVPILGMHQENPTNIVKAVLRRGFTPVWLSELADALAGRRGLPPHPVVLTLDDGMAAWYTTSHAVFQQYQFKASLCVTSDILDAGPAYSNGPGITWDQAREMNDSGLYDWQNHTKTHTSLASLSVDGIRGELDACSAAIVDQLGVAPPVAVIYPNGLYNDTVTSTVRAAGYEMGLKFSGEDNRHPVIFGGAAPYTLNRAYDFNNLLQWARHPVIYDYGHDMTGGRNAGNVLDFWSMPAGGSLQAGGTLRLDSAASSAALSLVTTDYFNAFGRLYAELTTAFTSATAGVGKVSILQYDAARAPLASIDLATVTAGTAVGSGRVERNIILDDNCQFVRLEISGDAAFDGIINVSRWMVHARI